MEYRQFFSEVYPRMETARRLERELDRKLAHRFNVLDYLRDDELGLSRLLADLLDPLGKHGQGTLFLATYLEVVGAGSLPRWPDLDDCRIDVETERSIDDRRRIDISIDFQPKYGEAHCLAIENKPYAGDQQNQIRDYLRFLRAKYGNRFLLIYLSPAGEGPSEWSIGKREREDRKDHFAIMPYYRREPKDNDEIEQFLVVRSLTDWFQECHRNCEVDRLRWFLRDAESFCKQTFGGVSMRSNGETTAIREFILSRSDVMETAAAVHRAWFEVRDRVGQEFLLQLCRRIENAVKSDESFPGDIAVGQDYGEGRQYKCCIWLYRKGWVQNENGKRVTRTSVHLENQQKGLTGWCIGIRSPIPRDRMEDDYDARKHDHLVDVLSKALDSGKISNGWPWWKYLDENMRDWDFLVPELWAECQRSLEDEEPRITAYIAGKFLELAKTAIPIISEVELGRAGHVGTLTSEDE